MALFSRVLYDVTGCDIPSLGLNAAEKSILELIGSEDGAFVNPVEGLMIGTQQAIADVLSGLDEAAGVTFLDENGNPVLDEDGNELTTFGYLGNLLRNTNDGIDDYRIHSDRLSGVSISRAFDPDSPYGPGGIQGEFPGLAGLNSVALQYNALRETLRDPAKAAEDYYSPLFNSILGPGTDLVGSINALVKGDVETFLANFPTGGFNSLTDLAVLGTQILDARESITSLINDDNLQYEFALDFIAKQTTGLSVLSMLDDPCFGQRLLGQIGSPKLKQLGEF